MKVLIAEDDTASRRILAATLNKLGHEVIAAADGREAWATFQSEPVHLVISDWMMPQMDGLELCRRMRVEVERYVNERTDASFSHGICPDSYESRVKPDIERWEREHPR